MNDEVAGKIVEAYKTNPMLTGLLILNIGMFIGFGWYVTKVEDNFGDVFKDQLRRIDKMQDELLDLAKTCVVPK